MPSINKALLIGDTLATVGKEYGFSESALCRHRQAHIPATLKEEYAARGEEPEEATDNLLDAVDALREKTMGVLGRAEFAEVRAKKAADRDRAQRTTLLAIREARACMELLGRLMGELRSGPTINVLVTAEWIDLRTQILQAVAPYPEARQAIMEVVAHEVED